MIRTLATEGALGQQVPVDDCRERALTAELDIFCGAVIEVLCSALSHASFSDRGRGEGRAKRRLVNARAGGAACRDRGRPKAGEPAAATRDCEARPRRHPAQDRSAECLGSTAGGASVTRATRSAIAVAAYRAGTAYVQYRTERLSLRR